MEKLVVIGLDSVPPSIVYDDLRGELENIEALADKRFLLRSCHPPITVPAWAVAYTGKTPGELGLYGFRHRRPGDVQASYLASSKSVEGPTLWDVVGDKGGLSLVFAAPPSYPPRPVKGYLVTDFLTPDSAKSYTWPPNLRVEVERVAGAPMIFDIVYRSEEKDKIVKELWRMTEMHFKVVKHLAKTRKWDLLFMVEIGPDRLHHAFWKYYDPSHPRYPGPNKYEHVIPDYYKLLDKLIGELAEAIPRGSKIVIMSDHGAKGMTGAFAINQWLIDEGYLVLKRNPDKPGVDLSSNMIDWEKTIAWAWGGYYARLFINLKGREPHGIVDPEEYDAVREEIRRKLWRLRGPNGENWRNEVYKPEELYPAVKGDAPDLIIYLDDLNWRPAGTIGWKEPYLEENDRGPDDAVHDWDGVFMANWDIGYKQGYHLPIESVFSILKSVYH